MFRKIFQVSADEGMGINKVNVWSFQLKNVSKFVIAWLAREKQNILAQLFEGRLALTRG